MVIFKKGDPAFPSNYRPIAVLPVMYKLFATVLLGRIRRVLDRLQPLEQAGFRASFSCSDHVHTLRLLAEKASEWGQTLWVASLDLEKAFDKVLHDHVFDSLLGTGVEVEVIQTLRKVYSDMCAYVQLEPGNRSRTFSILRGVRQGDPLSPILFINVLRKVLSEVAENWEQKKRGSIVGAWGDTFGRLTHLLFADDTTLVAKSKKDLKAMLCDIKAAFGAAGLSLNVSKCKIQTNAHTARTPTHLEVDGLLFPILHPSEGFKVLGVQYTLLGGVSAEIDIRIAAAWGKFHSIWPLLKRRDTDLTKRLRLFDSNVTRSALWCCESWTLTVHQKRKLQSAERAMLRRFAGPRRAPREEYLDWLRRSTYAAEAARDAAGLRSWNADASSRKWHWAGHVARMNDHRWASRLTVWRNAAWWAKQDHGTSPNVVRPMRARAGHFTRWESEVRTFAQGLARNYWNINAAELMKAEWNSFANDFCSYANKSLQKRVD